MAAVLSGVSVRCAHDEFPLRPATRSADAGMEMIGLLSRYAQSLCRRQTSHPTHGFVFLPTAHSALTSPYDQGRPTTLSEGEPVRKLKLALFALDTFSKMSIDKAGADWVGGDLRRARAAARVVLFNEAMDALIGRGPEAEGAPGSSA
jgi:hypothetical protein